MSTQSVPAIDQLNQQAWAIFRHDGELAEELCRQALAQSEAEKPHYLRGKLESLRTLAHIYNGRVDYKTGRQISEEALALLPEEELHMVPKHLSRAWMLAANANLIVEAYTGDIHEALVEAYRLLSVAENLADNFLIAIYRNVIGAIHQNLNEPDEAIKSLNQCVALLAKEPDSFWRALALYNLGTAYENRGNYDEALDCSVMALAISRREKIKQIEATALYQIGEIYLRQGQFAAADEHLQQALAEAKATGRKEILVVSLLVLGELALAQERPDQAFSWLTEGKSLAEEIGFTNPLRDFYRLLAKTCKLQGNYQQALLYFEQFHKRHSEIFNEEKSQRLARMRVLHEAEAHKHQSEIYKLNNVVLADKNKKLKALTQEKDDLLAIVAHDLKTPLASVMLSAEGLQMALATGGASPKLIERYTDRLLVSGTRMQDIIERLLLVNRLESEEIEIEFKRLDLQELLAEWITEILPQAQSKGIMVVFDPQRPFLFIESDDRLLHELIQNLLSNAVKYSQPNTKVEISLATIANEVVVTVADEGPGLTPDDKLRLFQKFARLSASPTAGESSTGLGLYIAHHLVTKLNGRIWAESAGRGKGSQFKVALPSPEN